MARTCYVAVTINFQGSTVERRELPEEMLFGRHSYGKYAAAVGMRRLLATLDRLSVSATVFMPGAEAEAHADLVREIAGMGHEIAAHGWAMEDYGRDAAADLDLLKRTHETLGRLSGAAPSGWRAPTGRLSTATLSDLAQLGYLWDSSFQDDDFPYLLDRDGGAGMVEVPQTEMLVDASHWNVRATHDRFVRAWRDEIAALHAERCFIALTLHPRSDYGSGRASRVAAVEGILGWLRGLPDVRFVTCGQAQAAAREGRLFLRK
jgi:peptidoglycan/xylan/chitin deacetylase (PgdA/CDA1 family)